MFSPQGDAGCSGAALDVFAARGELSACITTCRIKSFCCPAPSPPACNQGPLTEATTASSKASQNVLATGSPSCSTELLHSLLLLEHLPPSSTVWSAKAPQVFQHRSRHPARPLCRSAGGVFLHGFGTLYIKSILRLLIIAGAWPPGARGKLCAAATFCCGHPESPATNLTRCGSRPQAGEV